MTPNEIKTIFGIDITDKNRSVPYIALRYFCAEAMEKELKGNPKHFDIIAKELNFKRVNVYNCLLKAKELKKDKLVKLIYKAFKTKDKTYLDEYFRLKAIETKNYNKTYKDNLVLRSHVPAERKTQVIKTFSNAPKLSNLKLAEFLRNNNVLKHELWDVPTKNISANQWQQLRNINKNMFDSYAN